MIGDNNNNESGNTSQNPKYTINDVLEMGSALKKYLWVTTNISNMSLAQLLNAIFSYKYKIFVRGLSTEEVQRECMEPVSCQGLNKRLLKLKYSYKESVLKK